MVFLRRILKGEDGQVTAYFVGITIVVFGFMALAIDVGFFFHARRVVQNAADPAALAGAAYLPGCSLAGEGLDPEVVAEEYASTNLEGKAFTRGDQSPEISVEGFTPPGGTEPFASVYALLKRDQNYLLAQFLPGLRGAFVEIPGEAQAVCGPIQEGDVCPMWIEGDPDDEPVYGTDPDPDDNIPAPVISAYGVTVGQVYGMKVNDQSEHYGALEPPGVGGFGMPWARFLASGCSNDSAESLNVCEGCYVENQPGNSGNPVLDGLEGGGGLGSTGLYEIEKFFGNTYSPNLFPNKHLDCDLALTLASGQPTVVTGVRRYSSTGTRTGEILDSPAEVIAAINEMTDPSLMATNAAPCGGQKQNGDWVPELTFTSVQGRFMDIVMVAGPRNGAQPMEVLGIMRMYVACWTNQKVTNGNNPASQVPDSVACVPSGEPSDTTIYGVFGDFTAPSQIPGGGLGTNPLSPKHVVLVK